MKSQVSKTCLPPKNTAPVRGPLPGRSVLFGSHPSGATLVGGRVSFETSPALPVSHLFSLESLRWLGSIIRVASDLCQSQPAAFAQCIPLHFLHAVQHVKELAQLERSGTSFPRNSQGCGCRKIGTSFDNKANKDQILLFA